MPITAHYPSTFPLLMSTSLLLKPPPTLHPIRHILHPLCHPLRRRYRRASLLPFFGIHGRQEHLDLICGAPIVLIVFLLFTIFNLYIRFGKAA
ncbi:MAG: hypothetical protein U0X87_03555 [Anaerolineales bacterium]